MKKLTEILKDVYMQGVRDGVGNDKHLLTPQEASESIKNLLREWSDKQKEKDYGDYSDSPQMAYDQALSDLDNFIKEL